MHKITIYRHYFTNCDCYKSGVKQEPKGIQVHSTGANNPYLKRYVGPNDGRLGENKYGNYHNKPGLSVCANAYIGKLEDGTPPIYQTLPWEYRCWLCGSGKAGNANKLGYIGFEICEDNKKNKDYFE
jgi:N-acetylmuramoyl-L-alanine amidase